MPLTTPYKSSADTNDIQHDTLIYKNPSLFNNDDNNNGDNDFDLYFDTVLDASSSDSNDNDNDFFGRTDDAMIYAVYDEDSSAINDAPFTIMMTTQVHSSQSLKDIAIANGTTNRITLHAIAATVVATTVGDNNNNATTAAISISFINSSLHNIDHGSLV